MTRSKQSSPAGLNEGPPGRAVRFMIQSEPNRGSHWRAVTFGIWLLLGLLSATPACTKSKNRGHHASPAAEESGTHGRPEAAWLARIGTGPAQTERVCRRGAEDRIVRALCAAPSPHLDGLTALYEALGLVEETERSVATTTHSLGLSARAVSAANPRTFVFVNNTHYAPIPFDKLAAVTFARGEQFVELVALDTVSYDYNFYLLAFEQACTATRCTPEQLLTDRIERDWTSWTLYSDADLVDTPLDCLSCHLPFGRGTHKLLLMRQLADPWLHWGDFRGVNESADCSQDGPVRAPGAHNPGEGLDLLAKLEGPNGRHAGIPVSELVDAKSGRVFSDFMVDARLRINDSPYGTNHPQSELEFDSAGILCERVKTGKTTIWERYRADLTRRGLPVAFHQSDVLDPVRRAELLSDRAGVLARAADRDAFELASSWMSQAAAEGVGLVPRDEDSAPDILRQMCVRCHSKDAPPGSRRASFDAGSLDRIDGATARAIRERITLPADSPKLMPPRRAGVLTPSAIDRIERYLDQLCAAGCE